MESREAAYPVAAACYVHRDVIALEHSRPYRWRLHPAPAFTAGKACIRPFQQPEPGEAACRSISVTPETRMSTTRINFVKFKFTEMLTSPRWEGG